MFVIRVEDCAAAETSPDEFRAVTTRLERRDFTGWLY
jgi:hypothetical protein